MKFIELSHRKGSCILSVQVVTFISSKSFFNNPIINIALIRMWYRFIYIPLFYSSVSVTHFSTSVGEENGITFIKVWKPLSSRRVLKILKGTLQGKQM